MAIRLIACFFLVIFSNNSFACFSDFECGYGNRCVKPSGSINMNGVCIEPTNNYGVRDYSSSYNTYGRNVGPQEIDGCSFDLDCPIGFSCLKRSGELQGICIK